MIKKAIPFLPLSFITISLILVIILSTIGMGRQRYLCFFPLDSMEGKNAEIRYLFKANNKNRSLDLFVKELLLGPVVLEMNRIVPPGTKLKASLMNGQTLYLDFNKDFITESASIPLNYKERIQYIDENVKFNFPKIKNVVITVEGQVPGSVFFTQSEFFSS